MFLKYSFATSPVGKECVVESFRRLARTRHGLDPEPAELGGIRYADSARRLGEAHLYTGRGAGGWSVR